MAGFHSKTCRSAASAITGEAGGRVASALLIQKPQKLRGASQKDQLSKVPEGHTAKLLGTASFLFVFLIYGMGRIYLCGCASLGLGLIAPHCSAWQPIFPSQATPLRKSAPNLVSSTKDILRAMAAGGERESF